MKVAVIPQLWLGERWLCCRKNWRPRALYPVEPAVLWQKKRYLMEIQGMPMNCIHTSDC